MDLRNLALVVLSVATIAPSTATAQWSAARGGPERLGIRPGVAQLDQVQESWVMRLGGTIGGESLWVLDTNEPKVLIAAGGRISAKAWDDVVTWESPLLQANSIVAVIDVDQDGTNDTIIANRSGRVGTLTILNMDGTVRWIAPTDLGPVINGVRVEDLDGDGDLDILVTPYKAAEITAFSLMPISQAPSVLWEATRTNRDYKAGFFDLVGEFDGLPGLDVVSAGHRFLYLHDAATGILKNTSTRLEVLPYGRAALRAEDIDGDGVEEIFGFSDQGWAAPQNRRHVSSYSWNNSEFVERWALNLDDPSNDRLAFSDHSLGDFNGDGNYEIAVSVFDSVTSSWSFQVRDAADGIVLASLEGPQITGIVDFDGQRYLSTTDADTTKFFKFDGENLSQTYSTSDWSIAQCREQRSLSHSAPTSSVCKLSDKGVLLFSRDNDGRVTKIAKLDSLELPPTVIHEPQSASIVRFWTIPGDGPASVAIALSTGEIRPLTTELVVPEPVVNPPYSWNGVFYGNTTERTNFARFPLSFTGTAESGAENLLVIRGDREAVAIAPANGATVAGGVTELWSHPQTDRISLDSEGRALLFNQEDSIAAVSIQTGTLQWNSPHLFDYQERQLLHHAPLLMGDETWFHKINGNTGSYELVSVSNIDGSIQFSKFLDSNNSGWRRLTLVSGALGEKIAASGRINEVWTYDARGVPTRNYTGIGASMIIDINGGWLQFSRTTLEKITYSGASAWIAPIDNSTIRLGTILNSGSAQQYITSSGNSNELLSFNTEDGESNWSVFLSNGTTVNDRSDGDVVFGNVTGIDELSATIGAAVLVGGSDGFLYALAAEDGSVVWSLDMGAPVGEIITADWDGDNKLELVVVTENGLVHGIDTVTVARPAFCFDIDPEQLSSTDDIDRVISKNDLAALWGVAQGASSYEVAVYTIEGDLVRDFSNVGDTTVTRITGLPLVSGERYRIAVRAIYPDLRTSTDVVSDGVTVLFEHDVDEEVEDAEPPPGVAGCGCSSSSGQPSSVFAIWALGLWAIVRRKPTHQ